MITVTDSTRRASLEIQPVKRERGFFRVCEESEAEFWGIYRRGSDGLATHLDDCSTLAAALCRAAELLQEVTE